MRRAVFLLAAGMSGVGAVYACAAEPYAAAPADDGGAASDGASNDATAAPDTAFSPLDGTVDGGLGEAGPSVRYLQGCADGTREGLTDVKDFPTIAACEGAFFQPGIRTPGSRTCDAGGGNSGTSANGMGCSALDLCAIGWHVCRNAGEVGDAGGCGAIADSGSPATFFATAQPSVGSLSCTSFVDDTLTNDVFGCGNQTNTLDDSCAPLTTSIAAPCDVTFAGWVCGNDGADERATVMKLAGPGGVLCCRD